MLPAPAHLPARVLAALTAAEGLGEPHLTLAPTATWRSDDDPATSPREIADQLTLLGWRGRDGRLEREVAASLNVLCRPAIAYYGWITHQHATTAILAAAIGKEAVLAVRRPDATVWLSTIGAGRLAERLVAQIPDMPAGHGLPITVQLAELRAAGRTGRVRTKGGVGIQLASPDVRKAQEIMALPTTGAGELWVAASDQPVIYADTTHGRYLQILSRDGQLRISPAQRADLVAALRNNQA